MLPPSLHVLQQRRRVQHIHISQSVCETGTRDNQLGVQYLSACLRVTPKNLCSTDNSKKLISNEEPKYSKESKQTIGSTSRWSRVDGKSPYKERNTLITVHRQNHRVYKSDETKASTLPKPSTQSVKKVSFHISHGSETGPKNAKSRLEVQKNVGIASTTDSVIGKDVSETKHHGKSTSVDGDVNIKKIDVSIPGKSTSVDGSVNIKKIEVSIPGVRPETQMAYRPLPVHARQLIRTQVPKASCSRENKHNILSVSAAPRTEPAKVNESNKSSCPTKHSLSTKSWVRRPINAREAATSRQREASIPEEAESCLNEDKDKIQPVSSPNNKRQIRMRSTTSTGFYPTGGPTIPTRLAKSARSVRQYAQLETAQDPNDMFVACRDFCLRLEEDIFNNNLQHFTTTLGQMQPDLRRRLVNYKLNGEQSSSLFFRAAQLVRLQFVEFMLKECSPNLEQTGVFTIPDDVTIYMVTPLWHAAVSGHDDLALMLVHAGSDVNSTSSTGSSVLRAACCMARTDIVKMLLNHGADVNDRRAKGVTCLMSSVHSAELVRILVARGARVNEKDEQGNTALHHAAEDGELISVAMLLDLGANAHLVNNDGCSVLQMAAKHRQTAVMEFLLEATSPKVTDVIDAYDILGAMMILMEGRYTDGVGYLKQAMTLANMKTISKDRCVSTIGKQSVLAREFGARKVKDLQELASISDDRDALEIQALLTYERSSGAKHDSYLTLLMFVGAIAADNQNFRRAVLLWKVSYTIYHEKYLAQDSHRDIWNPNMFRCLQFVARVLQQSQNARDKQLEDSGGLYNDLCLIPEEVVRCICRLVTNHIMIASKLIESNPMSIMAKRSFPLLLRTFICVFSVYMKSFSASEQNQEIGQMLKQLIQLDPRESSNGRSLLHLCFEIPSSSSTSAFRNDALLSVEPCYELVDVLLLAGLSPVSVDYHGSSVLHQAAAYHSYNTLDTKMFHMLLKRGAHTDQINSVGELAADLLPSNDSLRQTLTCISLKCIAARQVAASGIHFYGQVPVSLYSFIDLHRSYAFQPT